MKKAAKATTAIPANATVLRFTLEVVAGFDIRLLPRTA